MSKIKTSPQQIKFIRAIRICKTPALGGHEIKCLDCKHRSYYFNSCGHSHCPLCQKAKTLLWQDRIKSKLLAVPYVHGIFTVPQEIHYLFKANDRQMYSLLMRTVGKVIKQLCLDTKNVGGVPGVIAVLHSFGSDLKFHPHVHCLITFGGWDKKKGKWKYPRRRNSLYNYKDVCDEFRKEMIKGIEHLIEKEGLEHHGKWEETKKAIEKKRWNVKNCKPVMDTERIEKYLSRYICKQGITADRLEYLKEAEEVRITYNDYRNQEDDKPAPKEIKVLHPLDAIAKILQHVLPPYLHKSRYYGLHHHAAWKNVKDKIEKALLREPYTPRRMHQILKDLWKDTDPYKCKECGSTSYEMRTVNPDKSWKNRFLKIPLNKGQPREKKRA